VDRGWAKGMMRLVEGIIYKHNGGTTAAPRE